MIDSFSPEICRVIGWYVYRLIDPRNGHTFYVGKGCGNRIFAHIRDAAALSADKGEDVESLKLLTIREIRRAGLLPLHVIHRFGMDEKTAFEVEGALIDAYAGLTNIAGGYRNSERGAKHADEISRIFSADPMVAHEHLILIYIGRSRTEGRDIYSAVRCAWRLSIKQAARRKLVLAYDGGLIVGAYRPQKWLQATHANFPELAPDYQSSRVGFVGVRADDVWDLYVGKRPPARQKGAQNPVTYIDAGSL